MENQLKKYLVVGISAFVFTVGIFASTYLAVDGFKKVKSVEKTVTVTGSAKKIIKSDLIIWKCSFNVQSPKLSDAYAKLNSDLLKVKEYLIKNGLTEKDFVVQPISTTPFYVLTANGMSTSTIDSYKLNQEIEIRSSEIDKITNISRQATSLINEGIEFQSMAPQYMYTKIADIKVDMLAQATKDARNRAEKIALNAGTKINSLKTAKMGVFQITPPYSTEVSDYGIYDTSSIEKEITGVMNCVFTTK